MSDHDDLKEQMAKFAAARIDDPVALQPARVGKVVAVHDGTDQDAVVDALAAAIAGRCAAQHERLDVDARGDGALDAMLAIGTAGDMLVVPSPFGRDYQAIGQQTLSTVVDLLLARSDASICVARAPLDDAAHAVAHPIVGMQIDRHRKVPATALALALAQGGGELLLLSTVDPHAGVRDEELIGRHLDPADLSPEVLAGLASARAGALTAALQRHAHEWRVDPRVLFAVGDTVDLLVEHNESRRGLVVAGRERDPRRPEAHDARRLVLASRLPVLLV